MMFTEEDWLEEGGLSEPRECLCEAGASADDSELFTEIRCGSDARLAIDSSSDA